MNEIKILIERKIQKNRDILFLNSELAFIESQVNWDSCQNKYVINKCTFQYLSLFADKMLENYEFDIYYNTRFVMTDDIYDAIQDSLDLMEKEKKEEELIREQYLKNIEELNELQNKRQELEKVKKEHQLEMNKFKEKIKNDNQEDKSVIKKENVNIEKLKQEHQSEMNKSKEEIEKHNKEDKLEIKKENVNIKKKKYMPEINIRMLIKTIFYLLKRIVILTQTIFQKVTQNDELIMFLKEYKLYIFIIIIELIIILMI